jgi:ABC-type multidrug transport system fused ATPase/permease subunit
VVLDDGGIAELGTHAALRARDGLSAGFWGRLSGGFLDVGPAVAAA